jgi:Effector protein
MSGVLGYIDIPGIRIRNGVEKIGGEDFEDITDWGGSFIEHARAALLLLRSRPLGKQLVDGLSKLLLGDSRSIVIEPAAGFEGQNGPGWSEELRLVRWNTAETPRSSDDFDQMNDIPAFIILGHELVHALHSASGSTDYAGNFSDNKAIEEAMTVGLGPWKDNGLTENGLRSEWKLKARTTFSGVTADRLLRGTKFAKF